MRQYLNTKAAWNKRLGMRVKIYIIKRYHWSVNSWIILDFECRSLYHVMKYICLVDPNLHFNRILLKQTNSHWNKGPSWSWSYGSWVYNNLCNQWLSPLMLWFRMPPRGGVLYATFCDKFCQWLATGWWFTLGTPVFFIKYKLTGTIYLKWR